MIEKRVSKMKMIDVCRQTELSERTVRYYVQRGLLHPISGEKGERTYMDFSSADVRRLEQVAALRKAGFSIEEILNMIQSPDTIPAIVMDRRHELAQTAQDVKMLLKAFDRLQSRDCRNMETLADTLSRVTASLSLPAQDAEPDFSRFEHISQEERDDALLSFHIRHEKMEKCGRRIILVFMIIQIILFLVALIFKLCFGISLYFALPILLSLVFIICLFRGDTPYHNITYLVTGDKVSSPGFFPLLWALFILGWIGYLYNLKRLSTFPLYEFNMNDQLEMWMAIIQILIHIILFILYFTNSSVKEFIYNNHRD